MVRGGWDTNPLSFSTGCNHPLVGCARAEHRGARFKAEITRFAMLRLPLE